MSTTTGVPHVARQSRPSLVQESGRAVRPYSFEHFPDNRVLATWHVPDPCPE